MDELIVQEVKHALLLHKCESLQLAEFLTRAGHLSIAAFDFPINVPDESHELDLNMFNFVVHVRSSRCPSTDMSLELQNGTMFRFTEDGHLPFVVRCRHEHPIKLKRSVDSEPFGTLTLTCFFTSIKTLQKSEIICEIDSSSRVIAMQNVYMHLGYDLVLSASNARARGFRLFLPTPAKLFDTESRIDWSVRTLLSAPYTPQLCRMARKLQLGHHLWIRRHNRYAKRARRWCDLYA
jgi:hypothetical protein